MPKPIGAVTGPQPPRCRPRPFLRAGGSGYEWIAAPHRLGD
jgi:hypothetical protein